MMDDKEKLNNLKQNVKKIEELDHVGPFTMIAYASANKEIKRLEKKLLKERIGK